ncbi:MAG: hypothetical protein IPI66_08705 [Chitinophagaceae bacterium]|nr:hypothetical protein [Chitinophagaceae bacterium]
MIRNFALALLLVAGFAACKSKDAFNYSQEFVKKERSLLPDINKTEDNVKRYIAAEQYDSIAIAGANMEKIVDAKLKEIRDEPAPKAKEADNFKEAGIKYFLFIKSMYTGYKDFGNAKTPEDRETEMNKLRELVDKKTDAVNDMQAAQRKYADANGFKLETK